MEDEKDMNYREEADKSDEAESDEAEEEGGEDAGHSDQEFEEVVNIRPDQSPEDREDQDEEERRPGFEDEEMERPDDDGRMMDGNEGDPDDQEISYDEGIEGFKRVS